MLRGTPPSARWLPLVFSTAAQGGRAKPSPLCLHSRLPPQQDMRELAMWSAAGENAARSVPVLASHRDAVMDHRCEEGLRTGEPASRAWAGQGHPWRFPTLSN